ncbi:MAG: porin [Sphingomonadaceae bacterium]|nr:porin [Sphingomonadaceae bacterium]
MKKIAVAASLAAVAAVPATAQEAPPAPPAEAPAAAPTAPALLPALAGPLSYAATPVSFDLDGFGKVYVNGALSGIGRFQDHAVPGDHDSFGDISNGQVVVQKIDGVFQFMAQAGIYSLPSLGVPYLRASRTNESTFGPIPQAFVKIAPTSAFSVQVGKLPTLVGAEYTFTFENMNIDRGLLWNLEPAVSKGVQANYTHGPLAFSLAFSDGYYSSKYSTLSGSVAWTIDPADVLAFTAQGNTRTITKATFVTSPVLNNQQIYDLIYTRTKGKWVIQPYIQYTHVDALPFLGTTSAETWGGAVLARYAITPALSLSGRAEYVSSSGTPGGTAANYLYGPGSDAWSLTLTPTYTWKIFFARAELSYVRATGTTAGFAFGNDGNAHSQTRGVFEVGVLF